MSGKLLHASPTNGRPCITVNMLLSMSWTPDGGARINIPLQESYRAQRSQTSFSFVKKIPFCQTHWVRALTHSHVVLLMRI